MSSGETWGAAFGAASTSAMQVYDDVLVPRMFEPWASLLVDQLELREGETVLDVACGPGSVTRIAAARVGVSGSVTGCDLSAAMLDVARAKPDLTDAAPITYIEASADRLPVDDASVDVALCQQGLQFFGDRPAALAEMHRALRPGGRLGIAVWASIDRCPPFSWIADAVEEVCGRELADRYRDGPWGFGDGEQLAALIAEAGFGDVGVASYVLPMTFEGGAGQMAETLVASGIASEIDQLTEQDRRRLFEALARRAGDGPTESQLESNIALGHR